MTYVPQGFGLAYQDTERALCVASERADGCYRSKEEGREEITRTGRIVIK
jgi:hypothetical protein